ncbi:MAG: histone deacetylase [candidate division KSB1 bacterium]|nr:histone deacetylase [candidate division KSB1 bacterium]MDZ7366950.1 histone deacetylase [candidate division KSB1 bacterium]MDZ7406835.1 histone deacetylase [candidate division KSB1 bacterium]
MHFVYSPLYEADIGIHVFPVQKYRLVTQALHERHHIPAAAFIEPAAATREQLLLVHTQSYLDDLQNLRWTPRTLFSELPLTRQIVEMSILACGGTIRAAESALEHGAAVHIGGGFHHAFAEKAEGFCYLNDLAVAVRAMQAQKKIRKAMVIDCDLHQGNGTAKIFQHDPTVFTFSIHQWHLYPLKEKSDLDIHLENGIKDKEYLQHLHDHLPRILDEFRPELILYQAGADPYEHDQLGDLRLTINGLAERDRHILQWAKERNIPIAVTLGGGYAYDTNDTVSIHVNTGMETWKKWHSL